MSLSPTLSHSRISSASATRILVLPLGPIQEDVFQRRLADLRRVGHTIPMQSLTYHAPSKDTPFKTINWKRGKMLFEFLDGSAPASEASTFQLSLAPARATQAPASYYASSSSEETDPFTDAPPPPRVVCPPVSLALNSDWDELHVYAKVMAVICICDIPTVRERGENGLKMAIQQFQDVRAQMLHPGGPFIYKCYAFNPDKDFEKQHRDSPVEHWAVFPPEDDEALDEEQAHADFFLQTCLFDLAAGLIDNFEASIKKLPVNADLKSPLETPVVIAQTPEQIASRNKKTRPGRQKKYVGDYCLLAGDPVGAIKHFKAAADACRSANDMIWFASALEGQASSLLAMEEEKEDSTFLDSVVSLFEESLSTLTKVPYASILSIESSFKLARYLLTGKKRLEASEILVRVYELKMDCSAHDQINLAVEAAILCHQIGFKRKFGFFLVQAAGLYRELHQSASCHALLRVAAPVYRLQGFSNSIVEEKWMSAKLAAADEWIRLEEEEAELEADTSKGRRAESDRLAWERNMNLSPLNYLNKVANMSEPQRKERGFRTGRWVIIQKAVLEHLIFSAKQMQDDELCASCTTYLLQTLYPYLDEAYQASLINDLWQCTKFLPINTDSVDMSGLPVVHSVRPLELCSELQPLHDPQAALGAVGAVDADDEGAEEEQMGSCIRLTRAERAGGDVFLARPDEAQHKKHARELHFVANETMDVEVMLSNPLKLPLLIQAITLSVTDIAGDSFESYPCSMTLQGESLQRIVLTGIARRQGALTIRGVFIRCFNLTWEHRVDAQGKGIRPSYDDQEQSVYCTPPPAPVKPLEPLSMNLSIEPAVPRLSLAYHVEGNMSSHSLLLGEKRKAVLLIQNVGRIEVSDIELKIDPQYVAMSAHSQATYYMNPEEQAEMERNKQKKAAAAAGLASPSLKRSSRASEKNKPPPNQLASVHAPPKKLVCFDPEQLKAQLPLKIGAVLRIPVEIFAHTDCCGARFILSYAATPKSPLFRCVQLPVSWKVEHGLRLNHLHLLHFVSSNPSSASSLTSSNSPSSAAALSPPLIIRRLSSEPSAEFPRMNSNDCMMILELTNSSLANFRLSCSVDLAPPSVPSSPSTISSSLIQQEFAVEKSCEKRIILPLPRMSFGNTRDDEYLRRLAHSCTQSSSPNWQQDETYQRFLRVFSQRVKLDWTSSEESSGVLAGFSHQQGIAPVEISPAHLVRLLPEPVEFEASLSLLENVSSSVTSPSPEADPTLSSPTCHTPLPVSSTGTRAQVGALHRLSVVLTNHSSEALSLEIGVLPFQEAVNGRWDTSLQSKLLLVGALTRQTQVIAPGQTIEHAISIVFTAVGRFNFQFTARQCGEPTAAVEESISIKAIPAVPSDPFSELEFIASSIASSHQHSSAAPETSSGASSPIRPSNTVRRRSMLPSESVAFPQYELDEDSDEDDSDAEGDNERAQGEQKQVTSESQWPHSHTMAKDLVFRCQNIMVVQVCL